MSGLADETNSIVQETEIVPENNVTQPERKGKRNYCYVCEIQCTGDKNFKDHLAGRKHIKKLGLPLPVPKQNTKEKTSKRKNTPKKTSKNSSDPRDINFKEKSHNSKKHSVESTNEKMNTSNRYNQSNKYNDSHFQNRYETYPNARYHYSDSHRTGKQYYNNRSYDWNSYSNSKQNHDFNYRPRHYFYSRDEYNASHDNQSPFEHSNFRNYNNCEESSSSGNYEKNSEHANASDNERPRFRNPFRSDLPSFENPFWHSESDAASSLKSSKERQSTTSSPKFSKERLGSEANVSNTDDRTVSKDDNALRHHSDGSISASNRYVIASKNGKARIVFRSRSLSASESDKKIRDKTDQAECSESEEQRIQEWTNSLLENNNNQITRLINPSTNKEKAAVNHLITRFSKSKRKEILTRTLRTNSSELTDNDDRETNEDISAEADSTNAGDEEILIVLDSKNSDSNLEQSDINLCLLSTSKTNNFECSSVNQEPRAVLESSKSPINQSSKMYKIAEKNKNDNIVSDTSLHNSNTPLRYKEKYVKRKSDGSEAKVKKKQKTSNKKNMTHVNTAESEDLNTRKSRKAGTPENVLCSSSTKTSNQGPHVSDIKQEIIEGIGETVTVPSSTTNSGKKPEENLVFGPDVSVDTLIQLFASGSVKVKEEFNDPVMDVLKEMNPDELINACSNNVINSCDETANISTSNSVNRTDFTDKSFSEVINHQNKNNMNPVILGSAAVEDNASPDSAPVNNCTLNINASSSMTVEPTSSISDRSEPHNHSTSCTDNARKSDNSSQNSNELNNAKVESPSYLNQLIKQLQDISSQEEKVKESLIEAKSKINEYTSLLEEWKTKKKVLNDQEESLRKERNSIIQLMQTAVKTDSDDSVKEASSTPLKDDRIGDQLTNKRKLDVENSAEVLDASKASFTTPSSATEKHKQMKTGVPPRTPEFDEIIIIPPPQKPQPPEIIICDDEESAHVRTQAKFSKPEMNSSMSSSKNSSIYDIKTIDAHTTVINSLVVFEDFLYTCSNDNTAKRFNLKGASATVTYQHTAKNVTEIVVEKVQNEALVFTSCSARLISLFIAASGTKIKNFFPPCPIMSICKGWGKFYAGLANGSVNMYNWKYEEIELVKTEHPASRIATAHQGRLHVLVILSSEGNIAIRDAETGLLIRYIKINIKHPSWMCLHSDLVYLSSADKLLILLDIMSGKVEKKLHMNCHTTGLAVCDDYIFTISYSGVINCYNKDKSNDKRVFYGAGKGGLTCVHVYHNWVFTGNRKGDVSLFHFDPLSLAACEFAKCDVTYGLKEDLEYHVEKDHLQKKKMLTQCNWRGCDFKFPRGADIGDKMNHVKSHIYQMETLPTN